MTAKRSDGLQYLWWILIAAIIGVLLYLLAPILAPFLFAAILAYICSPWVARLEKLKIPHTPSVALVMLLLFGVMISLLLVMVPLFSRQMALLVERLPGYLDWLRQHLSPWLQDRFGVELQLDSAHLREALATHWQSAEGMAAKFLPTLQSQGAALAGFLANLVLVPVVLFYVLRDWNAILGRIEELIPRRWHERTHAIAAEIDSVLAAFLRGQISVILLMSAFYSVGLWLAGLELALPIGILAGVLGFVPYLGVIVGLGLATLSALMQFPTLAGVVPVWVVFGLGQAAEGMLLTPWLIGDRVGLHPVAVIFAVLAGGQLFGFFGMLLALPVSAALSVGLRHLRRKYLASGLYHS